jgi:uncharacterized membrane protein
MAITSALTYLHVVAGGVALLSGAAAMSLRKGSRPHRRAGSVFFVSMLVMASLGGYLAFREPDVGTTMAGLLTVYVVATAWMAAQRRDGESGRFEELALLWIAGVGLLALSSGLEAAASGTGAKHGYSATFYYVVAGVAFFLAASDLRFILRGGLSGAARLARHLWRMGFGFFIAAGSLFLGQPQVFPEALRGTLVLAAPVILVIGATLYWLVRVKLAGRRLPWRGRPLGATAAVAGRDAGTR